MEAAASDIRPSAPANAGRGRKGAAAATRRVLLIFSAFRVAPDPERVSKGTDARHTARGAAGSRPAVRDQVQTRGRRDDHRGLGGARSRGRRPTSCSRAGRPGSSTRWPASTWSQRAPTSAPPRSPPRRPRDRGRQDHEAGGLRAARFYVRRGQKYTGHATQGSSSIGRAPVSKTGGCRFESCLPCSRVRFVQDAPRRSAADCAACDSE